MSASRHLLKIGDFAKLAETNLRTLRYYEELGLLEPAARSSGGFRYYRPTDVNRVHVIREMQELGLNLERIRELISARAMLGVREQFVRRVREALLEHDRLLSERIEVLGRQRAKLAHALRKIEECKGCHHTPGPENNFCEPCRKDGAALPDNISALF
jgi:DNA-binding transcriptional MerR regulator